MKAPLLRTLTVVLPALKPNCKQCCKFVDIGARYTKIFLYPSCLHSVLAAGELRLERLQGGRGGGQAAERSRGRARDHGAHLCPF